MSKKAMGFEKTRIARIDAWSFSRWNTWVKCPRKAFYKFVQRLKEPSGPAAARGDQIHKTAEALLKGKKMPPSVPADLKNVQATLKVLHKLGAKAEYELAVNDAWHPVGWWDKDVWCRIKIDVLAFKGKLAGVTDWKSGRYKPGSESYEMQLHLYGTGVLSAFPKVEEVEARLSFTDHRKAEVIRVYERKHLKEMQETWERRVQPMLDDRKFPYMPSDDCRRCFFRKSNGGPCKY